MTLPAQVGPYRLDRKLGEGGMGEVYLGVHQFFTDRKVAIKMILPDLIDGQDDEASTRLIDEGRALESLDHENVVSVYDLFFENGCYYLIMEFVAGQPLDALLKKQAPGIFQALELAVKIGSGLAAAHAKGILHRDIKPQNVMVGENGVVKVMDFGLAKFADASTKTRSGSVVGTPRYMSPEQIMASPLDARSDQYSFGILVYRLLCGREPFTSGDSMSIAYQHMSEIPPPPVSLNPRIPREVAGIILKALAKKPDDRYPTIKAMLAELEKAKMKLMTDGFQPPESALETGPLPVTNATTAGLPATAADSNPTPRHTTVPPRLNPPSDRGITPPPRREPPTGKITRPPAPAREPQSGAWQYKVQFENIDSLPSIGGAAMPMQDRGRGSKGWMIGILLLSVVIATAALLLGNYGKVRHYFNPQPDSVPAVETPRAAPADPSESVNRWIRITPPPAGTTVFLGINNLKAPEAIPGFRPNRNIIAPDRAYDIQQHEVSWGELDTWLVAHPDEPRVAAPEWAMANPGAWHGLPVSGITWSGARAYCISLGGMLPTEEQWEFAARGPERRANPWGDERVDFSRTRVYGGPSAAPFQVMQSDQDLTPGVKGFALHDLLGNVQEWTADLWRTDLPDQDESWVQNGDTRYRAVRGLPLGISSPVNIPEEGAAYRLPLCAEGECVAKYPQARKFVGFRCVRAVR